MTITPSLEETERIAAQGGYNIVPIGCLAFNGDMDTCIAICIAYKKKTRSL